MCVSHLSWNWERPTILAVGGDLKEYFLHDEKIMRLWASHGDLENYETQTAFEEASPFWELFKRNQISSLRPAPRLSRRSTLSGDQKEQIPAYGILATAHIALYHENELPTDEFVLELLLMGPDMANGAIEVESSC
jgi:hypothetical protein